MNLNSQDLPGNLETLNQLDLNTQDVLRGNKACIPVNLDPIILASLPNLLIHWFPTLAGTPQENKKVHLKMNLPCLLVDIHVIPSHPRNHG